MKIKLSNEITVTDPSKEVIDFCNENLVIQNPDFFKKKRLGLWTGNTSEVLYLFRTDSNKLILPAGCINEMLKISHITEIDFDLAQNPIVNYDGQIDLYDYQEEALKSVQKHNFGILQAPCGSGKTQIGISLAINLKKKTLWLTHTTDLLNQSYDRAAQYINKSLLGTITGGKVNIAEGITFATVQTMAKLYLSDYKYCWDVIIVDECHRVAGTPTSLTMFSKVINSLAAPRKYGLSATVHRGDGMIKSTFALLGEVAYIIPEEAVSEKTILVTVQEVKTGIKISDECLDTDGTIIYHELVNFLAENRVRTQLITLKILENKYHYNLILSDRLQHLKDIINHLEALGIPRAMIRMIDGKMTSKKAKKERKQALEDMRTGKANFLFASYNLGKEGLDIPKLDRLYLTLPKKDFAIVTQSIGRIGRKSENKEDAICFDFVDDMGYCVNAWKKRKTAYTKKGCIIEEEKEPANQNKNQKTFFGFGGIA